MGKGGVSGAVSFPNYIMDFHGYMMASANIRDKDATWLTPPDVPTHSVVNIVNSLWNTNPWETLTYTAPTLLNVDNEAQFDLYYANVTSYDMSNITNYVSRALLHVSGVSSSDIANLALDVSTASGSTISLFNNFNTEVRVEIGKLLALVPAAGTSGLDDLLAAVLPNTTSQLGALQTTAPTTLWLGFATTIASQMRLSSYYKEASILPVLASASQYSKENLKVAVKTVNDIIETGELTKLVTAFADRSEIRFQAQSSQYSGQMADINAIQSTGYLFGLAILKAEQMREVGDYDAQVSAQFLERGIAAFIQTHSDSLAAGTRIELDNAQQFNQITQAALQLLTAINDQGKATATDLLRAYISLFQANFQSESTRLGVASNYGANALQSMGVTYGRNLALDLDADRINKAVKEQRYQVGLQQVYQLLSNKAEFERLAVNTKIEKNRLHYVSRRENEQDDISIAIEDAKWEMLAMEGAINILSAPAGMTRALPEGQSRAASVLGLGLQGAAKGAAVGTALGGPGIGTAIGAGIGILGGLFQ